MRIENYLFIITGTFIKELAFKFEMVYGQGTNCHIPFSVKGTKCSCKRFKVL